MAPSSKAAGWCPGRPWKAVRWRQLGKDGGAGGQGVGVPRLDVGGPVTMFRPASQPLATLVLPLPPCRRSPGSA